MKLIFATSNENKAVELQRLMGDSIEIESLKSLNFMQDIVESEDTLEGNSLLKANTVFNHFNRACFADDTGLEVDALDGAPGVYSARYAGLDCNDKANNELLLHELKDTPASRRTARYHCTIVYLSSYDHPVPKIYNATWEGYIGTQETGKNGFGYDPLFYLPEFKCTAAELTESVKNTISHRGKALQMFKKEFLKNT